MVIVNSGSSLIISSTIKPPIGLYSNLSLFIEYSFIIPSSVNALESSCLSNSSIALRDFPLMHFATHADFEQYLQQKKNDVQQANQTLANRSLALQHPPFYTKETPRQNVSPAVVSFIQLQDNAQQQFKGKQV